MAGKKRNPLEVIGHAAAQFVIQKKRGEMWPDHQADVMVTLKGKDGCETQVPGIVRVNKNYFQGKLPTSVVIETPSREEDKPPQVRVRLALRWHFGPSGERQTPVVTNAVIEPRVDVSKLATEIKNLKIRDKKHA